MATYIFNGECPASVKQTFIDTYKAYHADTWYKYAGDTEWRAVSITGEISGGYRPDIPTAQIPDVNIVVALEIGSDVTSIGNFAFSTCISLTSMTMPDSVTSIGYGAFSDCGGLTSVTIPDSVMSIGEYAFGNCESLMNMTIGNSVTNIEEMAFGDCPSLTSVIFKGKTIVQVEEMEYYPWGIYDSSFITVI